MSKSITVNGLHKLLGTFIEKGRGRAKVAVSKESFSHPLESDAPMILDVASAVIQAVSQADPDGGTKINRDGSESYRTCLVLSGDDPEMTGYELGVQRAVALTAELNAARSEANELRGRVETEQARWQEAIYKECQRLSPEANIDGTGCDSGDPLDLSLAEIAQAVNWHANELYDAAQAQAEGGKDGEG